ncbi:MAG TPA: M67 family metallopeptidase [Vicinamibacteria bacterium]|nr:M67 family metallopeptidase [Vicinamibacteria bacterium]
MIRRSDLGALLARAQAGYPHEVCGVLLADAEAPRRVRSVVSVPNVASDPRKGFEIAPEDLLRVQREARASSREILGYYHSHPDHPAAPSETDRRRAAEGLSDGVVHLILAVEEDGTVASQAWVFRDATRGFESEPLEIE